MVGECCAGLHHLSCKLAGPASLCVNVQFAYIETAVLGEAVLGNQDALAPILE